MNADTQKRLAGEAAALRVEAGMTVGLGTGSTAAWFVRALAARDLPDQAAVEPVPRPTTMPASTRRAAASPASLF